MDREQEYNYRLKNRTKEELIKANKYNCDGLCYGNRFMCPRADYCNETRIKEGIATIIACIVYICMLIIVNPITWIIIIILMSVKKA